jgi:ribosomal protein S18 acetylase RimI-like enzyme
MSETKTQLLDNVPWHSIDGPLFALADRNLRAGRFKLDVAPFSAIMDDSPESWRDLAKLAGPSHPAVLFAPDIVLPKGWIEDVRFACYQMVAENVTDAPAVDVVVLGPRDVPEMIRLVKQTQPGPFSERTIDMGRYFGYRDGGDLVAMAGERLRCEGFTEVSAVCTAAGQRGKGLGAALTLAVVEHVRSYGNEAFLHVRTDNHNAIRLYLALGFVIRTEVEALIARTPGE